MKHKWLIPVGLGLTTAGVGLSLAVTGQLVAVALDRNAPKLMDRLQSRLTGTGQLGQLSRLQDMVSGHLQEAGCCKVVLTARDGERLTGHLWCCKDAKRTVLCMHGWRSEWSRDFGMIAEFLFHNGCNVLFAEQRGQGGSGGSHICFGLQERYDCLDWIYYLNCNGFSKLPIYLAGISMGATTVLMATGFPLPSNVHGVIADCGYTSPGEIFCHVAKNNLHLPYGKLRKALVCRLCRRRLREDPDSYSCQQALRQCRVPVLFIHGTEDTFVPISMTYENYKACAGPKELFVVPGAGHGTSYLVDGPGYEKRVLSFFAQYD